MTCHCGNCEDHPEKIQFQGSLEDLAWVTVDENTKKDMEFMDNKNELPPRRDIKLLAVVKGNNTFLQVWEEGKHIKEFKTGICANEMAFFFEDMVIPFRDMFEALGFSVTEEVYIEE